MSELVKPEVLDILKLGKSEDILYYLPTIRLDRKMYVAVNEVLERIGGKWNRKAKAHVFEDVDPAQLLDLIFQTGEMPPKNPTAFFPTPRTLIDEILHIDNDTKRILEPSAGKGNIAEAVQSYCQRHDIPAVLDCCEIVPQFRKVLKDKGFHLVDEPDFLQYQPGPVYDQIIMNPPFSLEGDNLAYITHITHAWSLLAPGGRLDAFVPSGVAFREDKRVKKFRALIEQHGSLRELGGGSFKDSGTGVNTVLISMCKPAEIKTMPVDVQQIASTLPSAQPASLWDNIA
jgi:hypothetical protein